MNSFNAPHIDYAGLSPVIALTAGLCVVLMAGLFLRSRWVNAALTIAVLGATAGLSIWQWGSETDLVAGALRLDAFGLAGTLIACTAAAVASRSGNLPPTRRGTARSSRCCSGRSSA